MTCKDCLHYKVCQSRIAYDENFGDSTSFETKCIDFKNKDEYFKNKDEYQKIVHAKWTNSCFYPTYEPRKNKKNGLQTAYCTNCHITQTVNTYKGRVQFNFCPYCGAKMDLE